MEAEEIVINILRKTNFLGRLITREKSDLEYKETFHAKKIPDYAKIMASFANRNGGIIIFGVKDSPRIIVGIDKDFDEFPQEQITLRLNSLYSPEINFERGIVELDDIFIGYIYTFKSDSKPIMAIKEENNSNIKSGDIFYRYNGQTTKIKFPELQSIIKEKEENARSSLLRTFETIAKMSTTNISILNNDTGILKTNDGGNFIVDKALMKQILKNAKIIKEGSFHETNGTPVLRVTGTVDFAEEVPVPIIDFNEKYPYTLTDIAKLLDIKRFDVEALVHKLDFKQHKKFSHPIDGSNLQKNQNIIYRYSQYALDFLRKKLDDQGVDSTSLANLRKEYQKSKMGGK